MKKLQKAFALFLVGVLFVSCSAASEMPKATDYAMNEETSTEASMDYETTEGGASAATSGLTTPTDDRKIIRSATLEIETLAFDETIAQVGEALAKANGYVSASQFENGYSTRWAEYTYRVPITEYEAFLTAIAGAGNVVSQQENSEDITAQYIDLEARLKSLTMQQDRLFEMLDQSGDLETLLAIQTQLSKVQYEIENYTSKRNTYDNLIAYTTISVVFDEVKHVTPVQESFSARVSNAFGRGWYRFGEDVKDGIVAFAGAIPTLLVWAIVLIIAWRVVSITHKKRKAVAQKCKQKIEVPQEPKE